MKIRRRFEAILVNSKIYFSPSGRTEDWLWIEIEPITILEPSSTDTELGEEIIKIYKNCKLNVPDVINEEMNGPGALATLAGFKTWPSFARKALIVYITEKDEGLEIVPSQWAGIKKGSIELDEYKEIIPMNSVEELGATLRQAFENCILTFLLISKSFNNCLAVRSGWHVWKESATLHLRNRFFYEASIK